MTVLSVCIPSALVVKMLPGPAAVDLATGVGVVAVVATVVVATGVAMTDVVVVV